MEVIPKLNRHFMPKALEVQPSGPPPQDPYLPYPKTPILNCLYQLLWSYL